VHAVEFSRIGRTHDQAKTITQGNFTIIPDPHALSVRHAALIGDPMLPPIAPAETPTVEENGRLSAA
jgi:hypothetical protein